MTSRTLPRPHRTVALECVALACSVILLHRFSAFAEVFLVGGLTDDGVYTVLGKALAEGKGYHSLHLVGTPVQAKYPPGFPWILAMVWRATGSVENVLRAVRWLHPVIVGLTAALLWGLGRARWRLDRGPLLLLAVLPLALDATIQYTAIPLAEPWFVLGWVCVLWAWEAAEVAPDDSRLPVLVLVGMLVAGTTLIRAQGIVLVPAVAAGLFLRRHTRAERAATFAAMLVPLAACQLYLRALVRAGPVALLPDEGAYSTWLPRLGEQLPRSVLASVLDNVRDYLSSLGGYLAALRPLGAVIVALVMLGTVVAGLVFARRRPVISVSVLGSVAMLLLWPFSQDRLLLAILPVGGMLLALALEPLTVMLPERGRRLLNMGSMVAVALILLRQMDIRRDSLDAVAQNHAPRVMSPTYGLLSNSRVIATASRWIRLHTAPDARIMIDMPAGIFLYTGRQTMPASPTESRFVRSEFAEPGRYLARHILDDSLTMLIILDHQPGIMADAKAVKARCPGVLRWGGVNEDDPPDMYRITPDANCLRRIARQ